MKKLFVMLSGIFGSIISCWLGGWDTVLQTLIVFMVIDWITGGILLPTLFHKSPKSENGALESRAGWKGLCRKSAVFLCILVAARLDLILNTEYLRNAVCIGFISNEALSIFENIGLMGVPLPSKLIEAVDVLQSKKILKEFAEKLNVTKDTIYKYEKNKTSIPHDIIRTLCQEYHLSADYFYGSISFPDFELEEKAEMKKDIYRKFQLLLSTLDAPDKQKVLDILYIIFR